MTRTNYDSAPLFDAVEQQLNASDGFRDARDQWEREYLDGLLDRNHGNAAESARVAKIDYRTLFRLLKKHGIKPETYR